MEQEFDLFGIPVPKGRGKPGRPVHVVTVENRNKVSMLTALGWSNERISNAIGISLPTLRKNYFHELKRRAMARDMMDAKRMDKLWRLGMEEGNVGALKEFSRLVERNDAMNAMAEFRGDEPKASRPAALGKKEEAQQAAEAAGESQTWGSDLAFRGRAN